MAWEWVGPTATSLVALAGVYGTWKAGKDGREHAEFVADQAASATLKREREARRAAAYVDVLTTVYDLNASITLATSPGKLPGDPSPEFPEPKVQVAVSAKVALYGSPKVQEAFAEWHKAAKSIMDDHQYAQISTAENQPDPHRWELEMKRPEKRQSMKRALDELAAAMNAELSASFAFPVEEKPQVARPDQDV